MVPEREMRRILLGGRKYRHEAKIDWIYEPLTEQIGDPQIEKPHKNRCCLDDRCNFNGREYTVNQLITQMNRGSDVGLRFAEEVYLTAQKQNSGGRSFGEINYSDAIHKLTHPNSK